MMGFDSELEELWLVERWFSLLANSCLVIPVYDMFSHKSMCIGRRYSSRKVRVVFKV